MQMAQTESSDPFERILQASNRNHLDNPFRTSDHLRRKHFPGAGGKLSHSRLAKAYLDEAKEPSPDWQLLAHGTWPWLVGHAHDLRTLAGELENTKDSAIATLSPTKRKQFAEQFSEAGTAEIETFLNIFANGGSDFQKAILEKLGSASAPEPQTTQGPAAQKTPQPAPAEQSSRPDVDDLDPITRAKMALVGTLFFFALSLIPLGIQFWREPDVDHWVVVGLSAILGLLTIVFTIDYVRKKP
jgi:hypothetical protein